MVNYEMESEEEWHEMNYDDIENNQLLLEEESDDEYYGSEICSQARPGDKNRIINKL